MRAIILAAGRGTRMGTLTNERPKCLTPFRGRTLLDWQLGALRQAGIRHIGIVRGYQSHRIDTEGTTFFENAHWERTNMFASLCRAAEWLEEEACLVSYSDIVYSPEAVRLLAETKEAISLTSNLNWRALWQERFADPLSDAETFRTDEEGWLTDIGRKPASIEEIAGQFMGLLKFTPEGWAAVKRVTGACGSEEIDRMDMTGLLSRLIADGVRIRAIPYDGLWLEVDSESDLRLSESRYGSLI
jgi:choline kinase